MVYKYNVGDRVRIVGDLDSVIGSLIVGVTDVMRQRSGNEYTIRDRDVTYETYNGDSTDDPFDVYQLEEEYNNHHWWTADMLEPIEQVSLLNFIQEGEVNG